MDDASRGRSWRYLVEASDVVPLNPDVPDHSQAGVHAALGRTSRVAPVAKTDLRRALADA